MDAAVALNPSLIALYWKEPDTSSNNGTGSGGARLPSCFVRGASHDPMRITIHIAVSTGAEEGEGGAREEEGLVTEWHVTGGAAVVRGGTGT